MRRPVLAFLVPLIVGIVAVLSLRVVGPPARTAAGRTLVDGAAFICAWAVWWPFAKTKPIGFWKWLGAGLAGTALVVAATIALFG